MEGIGGVFKRVEVNERCPIHGCKLVKIANFPQMKKPFCPMCGNEQLKRDSDEFDKQVSRQIQQNYLINNSLYGNDKVFDNTFDNFEHQPGTKEDELFEMAHKLAGIYFKYPDAEFNSIFYGEPGQGKTHLAMAILNAVNAHSQPHQKCIFINAVWLFDNIKRSWNKEERGNVLWTEDYAVSQIKKADLVVFDDIGSESVMQSGDHEASDFIQRVIYKATETQKRIIFTTNLSQSRLQKTYNPKVLSRMMAGSRGHILDFSGVESKRNNKREYAL